ncbi:MAG: hypothetical protein MIO90_05410, partial [Methanomassiliicoccales archaeon]|nr:hypothetical protein [Methanomassiliicoccales archaeon]
MSDYTTIAPSNQPLVGGQLTIFIKDNVTETVYIVISSASLAGASGNIIINPAPIDYYVVASTTPQVAGVGWSGTATGYDVFDNQVYTDDTTVVTMTQDGSAVFYTSATYTTSGNTYAVSAGIATFYVRDIVAPQTLALNATDENGKTGEIADIFVNYAPIDHFGVLVGDEPIEKIAGELWTANTNDVVVTARDEFGNFVDNYTGTPEWSASCDGSLPDSQAFVAGTYTFDGDEFSLNIAGEQIITMTDGEITGSSTNITIIPAEIDYYVVASTTPQIAGMGWSGTVTAYDEF